MRLLNAETLAFADFIEADAAPQYAILSHTWGKDEVTYKDMQADRESCESKLGFKKIKYCASQTIKDGLEYFWIDTCCIDKSSSAELSEAINSMFKWYQKAETCYAYLVEVLEYSKSCASPRAMETLWRSKPLRWFTRGWTLQELIAPQRLEFFSSSWERMGTRETFALNIYHRTGIPTEVLHDPTALLATSVAQRMSWASHRQTSRVEDLAYCLMGLFDVNMPMLYGEGEKAFIRLQEEIIKTSDDMSIFAWTDTKANFSSFRGLLAKSPSEFADCRDLRCTPQNTIPPYLSTNKGIKIAVRLEPHEGKQDEHIAWLPGVLKADHQVGVHVQKVGEDQYARVDPDSMAHLHNDGRGSGGVSLTTFFVRQQIVIEGIDMSRASGIFLHIEKPTIKRLAAFIEVEEVRPRESWDMPKGFIQLSRDLPTAVLRLYTPLSRQSYTLEFDTRKSWQDCLSGDKSWETSQIQDSLVQTMECQKTLGTNIHAPKQIIKMTIRRGVVDGRLKLSTSISTSFTGVRSRN